MVLKRADIILWLGDPAEAPADPRTLLLLPKSDLPRRSALSTGLAVSARTGEGIGRLVDALRERAASLLPKEGDTVLNARPRIALGQAQELLRCATEEIDPLIAAELVREVRAILDRITGRAGVEDMLDALFGRFCIGK